MPYKYAPISRTLSKRGPVKDIPLVTNNMGQVAIEVLGVIRNTIAKQVKIGHQIAQAKAPVRKVFKAGRRATFRNLSTLEMARIQRRMLMAEPGLVPQRISNRTLVTPNRANTYAKTWGLRESRLTGQETRTSVGPDGRLVATQYHTFRLKIDQTDAQHKWINENLLNKEGRRALRSAKIVEIEEAEWRDRGRGAMHIEVDANNNPTFHLGGNLRASIRIRDNDTGRGISYSIVAGGERAPYAKFMEFGTRYVAARPFLRPALKHVEIHLGDRVERDLRAHFGRG